MHLYNWFYKQSVGEEDMDTTFGWVQEFLRSILADGRQPFGIASGYTPSPGTGLAVSITTGVAFDKYGRRIEPSSGTIAQSITTDYAGASTAVAGAGNERWVSIFARGGRQFLDAEEDGSGNAVRRTNKEVLNSLGEGIHGPLVAYDATAALEAGVNKYHVRVGTEAVIGEGIRPALQDDMVLVCDVRLVEGQASILAADIFQDRRQWLVPSWLRTGQGEQALYAHTAGTFRFGVVREPFYSQGVGTFAIGVTGGHGYIYNPGGDGNYHRWDLHDAVHTVPIVPPWGSDNRQDLLVIDAESGLRVVTGSPGTTPLPPAVPAGSLALAEIRVKPGTVDASTYPIVPRAFRRLPYPLSTMTGIIEGCRLEWFQDPVTGGVHPPRIISKRNKVAFDGESFEFPGGIIGGAYVYALQDTLGNPFGSAAGTYHKPYFIYVCRNQYWENLPIVGPVVIIESTTPPTLDTGRPSVALGGPRGTIPVADALLIGVGWVRAATSDRLAVQASNDGWFTMKQPQPNLGGASMGGDLILPGAPLSDLVDKARIIMKYIPDVTLSSLVSIWSHGQTGNATNKRDFYMPAGAVPSGGTPLVVGEFEIAAPGGRTAMTPGGNPLVYVEPCGYHVCLPRIGMGFSA